jgi:phosphoglycolate phosphatase
LGEDRLTILFDLDGTLIDSTEAILESFSVAFDTHSTKKPHDDEIKALIGFPLDVMFSRLGVDESRVWDYVDAYKKHYRPISKIKTILLPQAIEAIELASSFATLGVVTTKTGLYSCELLENWGILEKFGVVIGRENVENPKPHKEPIEKALQALKKDKSNCWIIGDTILDAKSANNAGIECAGVTCGYGKKDELLQETKHIFDNAYEAIKYLETLAKK